MKTNKGAACFVSDDKLHCVIRLRGVDLMGNVAFLSDMKEVFRSNCTDLVSIPCHCTVRNVDLNRVE